MTTTTWKALKKQAEDATKPVPKDWYDLQVIKAEQKTASTGSLMISCQFRVDSGPQAGKTGIFNNFVFSPENSFALAMFFRNLEAFGFDDRFFGQLEENGIDIETGLSIIAAQLPNRYVRAELGVKTWNNQDRNEIIGVTTPTGNYANPPATVTPVTGGVPVPGGGGGGINTPLTPQPTGSTNASEPPPVPSF